MSYAYGVQFFSARLSGLVDATDYTFGVRAYNVTGEESNTMTVNVTADATGPPPVYNLSGGSIA